MDFIVICPNCDKEVIIEQLNCGIFRHGAYKANGQQLPPHESEVNCTKLIQIDAIYGCGKPFQVILEDSKYVAKQCGYI